MTSDELKSTALQVRRDIIEMIYKAFHQLKFWLAYILKFSVITIISFYQTAMFARRFIL
jgi:hypothetical protein